MGSPTFFLLPCQVVARNRDGRAWRRTFANLFYGLESMPANSRVLESSPYQHLRRVWRQRETLFRKQLLSGAHLRPHTSVLL